MPGNEVSTSDSDSGRRKGTIGAEKGIRTSVVARSLSSPYRRPHRPGGWHGRQSEGESLASVDSLVGDRHRLSDPCGIPIPIATAAVTMPVGIFLVVASVLLVVAAARELAKACTGFDVRKPTTSLVRRGVFRLIRNPVYFSMLLLCVGIALLANSVALLALSLPAGSALCLLVIRNEERYLEQKFGSAYLAYRASVRRWI
ncbi:MAG: hypothetical protein GEV13_23905 [Rhodospirillales bacterium]|nr:hypothetical protein [Rhodospirillales bacterium]